MKTKNQMVTSCGRYTFPTMPFVMWLGGAYKIYDYRKLSPYKRNEYWCEYRYNMVRLGMDYEDGSKFGCWG